MVKYMKTVRNTKSKIYPLASIQILSTNYELLYLATVKATEKNHLHSIWNPNIFIFYRIIN